MHLANDLGFKVRFDITKPVPIRTWDYYNVDYLYGDDEGGIEGEEDYFDPEYTLDSEVLKSKMN